MYYQVWQLPNTGGCILVEGRGCPPQTNHIHFGRMIALQNQIVSACIEKIKSILERSESHRFVYCCFKNIKELCEVFSMEYEVTVNNSVLMLHSFGYHTGAKWNVHHVVRIRTYVIRRAELNHLVFLTVS